MKVSDLKNRLSRYLRLVRGGESVLVTDRDRIVSRIDPAGGSAAADTDENRWLDDLERRGVIRRGQGKLPRGWLAGRLRLDADVVGALLDERHSSQ